MNCQYMKMIVVASLAIMLWVPVAQADDLLTGDTRLACEAILCLSSGERPGECGPALSRYFGINKKFWKDTVSARRNFLSLCPAASDPGMPGLVDTIASAAGKCTAEVLNRVNKRQLTLFIEEDKGLRRYKDDGKWRWTREPLRYTKRVTVITDDTPNYCRTYQGHGWTWQVGATYRGTPPPTGSKFAIDEDKHKFGYGITIKGKSDQVAAQIRRIEDSGRWVD